jgi:Tol biopolymer transport system component
MLNGMGSWMRYPILLMPFLVAACGDGGEEPAPTLSPSQTATSPITSPIVTDTETIAKTLLVLGGEGGHADAAPGVYLVGSNGSNLRRVGDRLYDARLQLGEDPNQVIIDGASYITGVVGWAPDGERLVFYACPSNPGSGDAQLYAVNADGSGLTRLSNPPGGKPVACYSEGGPSLTWSPDGSKLVYYSYTEPFGLYIVNADGTGTRFLAAGGAPQWSPQDNRIVFIRRPREAVEAGWKAPIYVIGSDGSGESELATVPLDCTGWALWGCTAPNPSWSPDGGLLAFTAVGAPLDFAQLQGSPISDVFVMKADGSGLTMLEDLPKNDPPGGGSHFAGWVNCGRPLPTAGCQVRAIGVGAQGLNLRQEPGTDKEVISLLSEGAIVCMLGSPALIRGLRWWPVRSSDGSEGWAALSGPDEPGARWLEPTGSPC